ncbi:DUF4391 domain-containing protein [Roseovarius sp. SCSIO 43702]|uniref:DUF4391 domain-containing protein n=1 Tax=Roseovarius sp. SCSIO 43702 TaxID=2823043 RepID=UPI001C72FA86|nr:DUF4391 domain-containing protein [Roseovarius sp. SCSIO 43702]QYX56521.1 DUF4391 domain-containing protein [Roseovarius sp. SCSIO 43702]
MTALFRYPDQAQLKRVVPKARIYDAVGASTALKDRFVKELDQITWAYKLAPETIRLPATKQVPEIQVFRLTLKTTELHPDVLRAIDRAVPFPLIFELRRDGQIQVAAARKRPSEADSAKWVLVGEHLRSAWLPEETECAALPVSLNLGGLYDQLLTALMPIEPAAEEDIDASLERLEAIKAKEREISQLKSKMKRETQFNIKMTLHGQLQEAQKALDHLKKPD